MEKHTYKGGGRLHKKKEKVNAVAENKRRSNSEFKMEWMNAGRKSVS
ncbi:MAG: hypothetical protein PUJ55_01605 [Clostridiales bacterium]|nr:hypothetical protein [Roseburia sp.]MDD7635615.1 hypothetical protein [Clostridiales bacterium]